MAATNFYIKSILGQDPIEVIPTPNELIIGINIENLSINLNIATTTLEATGTGVNIVTQGEGPSLRIASIASGDGTIEVSLFDDTLLLNVNTDYVNSVAANVSLASEGTGLSLVVSGEGPDMSIASVDASGAASVSIVDDTLIVDVPNVSVVSANAEGANVFYGTSGQEIEFRTVQGGPNAVVSTTADETAIVIDVNVEALDFRYNTSLETVGSGTSLVAQSQGPNLAVYAINAGPLIDIELNLDMNSVIVGGNVEQIQNLIDNTVANVQLVSVGAGVSLVYDEGEVFGFLPTGGMKLLDLIELSSALPVPVPNTYSLVANGSGPSLSLMNVAVSEGTMTIVRDEGTGTLYVAALSEFAESATSLSGVVDVYMTAGQTWWLASGLPASDSFGGFVRWIPSGTAVDAFDASLADAGHFENHARRTRLRIRIGFYVPSVVASAIDDTHYLQIVVAGSSVDAAPANAAVLTRKTFKMATGGADLVAVDTGDYVCPVYFEFCEDATYVFVGVKHNLPGPIGLANETTALDDPSEYGGIPTVRGGVRVYADAYSADPTL